MNNQNKPQNIESTSSIVETKNVEVVVLHSDFKSCCGDCKNNHACKSADVKDSQPFHLLDLKTSK